MKEELKKTENGEKNGSGSAEKTEKKKKLLSTECIVCIVIVILLYVAGVVALVMFPKSVSTFMKEARIVFQGSCKICGYKNDGKKSVSHECYYCKKCGKTHSYTIYNNPAATGGVKYWCRECCMMGYSYSSTNPPSSHCCKCKSNHAKGECIKLESHKAWTNPEAHKYDGPRKAYELEEASW